MPAGRTAADGQANPTQTTLGRRLTRGSPNKRGAGGSDQAEGAKRVASVRPAASAGTRAHVCDVCARGGVAPRWRSQAGLVGCGAETEANSKARHVRCHFAITYTYYRRARGRVVRDDARCLVPCRWSSAPPCRRFGRVGLVGTLPFRQRSLSFPLEVEAKAMGSEFRGRGAATAQSLHAACFRLGVSSGSADLGPGGAHAMQAAGNAAVCRALSPCLCLGVCKNARYW